VICLPTQKGKITVRQALILFLLSTLSPTIRLFPALTAKFAGAAGWISPLLSAAGLAVILKLLSAVFQNKDIVNLRDFFERALGKLAGRLLIILFLVWIVILYLLYIRYYAERLISTIFPTTSIKLFIAVLQLLVFMATRSKFETFARFCEVSILIFSIVFVIFLIFLAPSIKVENIWPVTHLDIIPIGKGVYPVLGIWGYVVFIFTLGDRIKNKDELKKHVGSTVLYAAAAGTLVAFTVIGSLGPSVTARMPIPFFSAVKNISILQTLNRLESVLLSTWVICDFIVAAAFAFFIIGILKDLFKIAETRYLSTPAALLGYGGSQYLAASRFELASFSLTLGLSVNIILCFAIPILVFIIGKIRRRL